MTAPALGFGVAGLGTIGRVHAVNLAGRIAGARLARVTDRSEAAVRGIGALSDVPCSTSYEDLLDDPRVGAVVVATPPSTHPDLVMAAAAAGKHVFCEKPLALAIDAAEEALAAVGRAGVLLQVGFHRRFDSDFGAVKARIDAGELGRVYSFFDSMRDLRPPPIDQLRSGEQTLLHDATCHDLDAARWLVGEIDEITTVGAALTSAEIAEIGEIDHAVTLLRFESGALGAIDNSLASGYGFDCRCEVVGSRDTVRVENPGRTPTFLERFGPAYPRELEAFVAAVAGKAPVAVTGEDGLAAVVLAEAAERSLESGRTVRLRRVSVDGGLRYRICGG